MSIISLPPTIEWRILRAAQKNKQAFAPIYEHYYQHILRFIRGKVSSQEVAEDLASQVFEKAIRNIDKFKWQGVSVSSWLYQIARNTVVDYYRSQKQIQAIDAVPEEELMNKGTTLEDQVLGNELLNQLLKELPQQEYDVVYKKFFLGYSNKLIASQTGLSETNVGTIVHRAVKRMREAATK